MEDNCCIRVYADLNQITRCKKRLESLDDVTMKLARTFALAGNHVRLNILLLLHEEGKMCPCDLSDILKMNLSAVSQHLRKLKDGKLVESKRTGQTVFYSVTDHFIRTVRPVLLPEVSELKKVRLA
jgi:DNA-binding transcriptional ArsR family regulator